MQKSKAEILLCVLAAGFILGSSGAVTCSIASEKEQQTNRIGGLDGRSFVGALGPRGKPKDVEDRFVFVNGTFVSKECELKCKYPARPYFVRKVGDKIEFISETKCPYKDATIVWRGTVEGDKIRGVSTWTVKRWYWTIRSSLSLRAS